MWNKTMGILLFIVSMIQLGGGIYELIQGQFFTGVRHIALAVGFLVMALEYKKKIKMDNKL